MSYTYPKKFKINVLLSLVTDVTESQWTAFDMGLIVIHLFIQYSYIRQKMKWAYTTVHFTSPEPMQISNYATYYFFQFLYRDYNGPKACRNTTVTSLE